MRRTHADTDGRDTSVGNLAPTAQAIVLRPGDALTVTRSAAPSRPAVVDGDGAVLQPAVIGSSLPSLIDDARPEH